MIYISYYTVGNYETVFKTYLKPSLELWNLKYEVELIKPRGSWQANTHYKAEFIKKMLIKHKQSVVFLDVDAIIKDYPLLFEVEDLYGNHDIALHYLDWYLLWRKTKGNSKREALSGTLYLKYNEKVLTFLNEWIEENNNNTTWEQKNMQTVLEKWTNKINVNNLSPEYCCIIMRDGSIPTWYVKEKPVIVHHQVSRKYKNKEG